MTSRLVTLPLAKKHLRVDHTDEDEYIGLLVDQASGIVRDYLKVEVGEWGEEATPQPVQAAVLLVIGNLYAHRGDDPGTNPLSQAVKDLVHRFRDPALA